MSAANWAVIREGCRGVIDVDEWLIAEATRLLFSHANIKAEPTGALALAAVLAQPEVVRGRRLCCLVTGGNTEPALYARLITTGATAA